jgi:hypothetical protein
MPVENLSRKPGEHWMAIVRKMERYGTLDWR